MTVLWLDNGLIRLGFVPELGGRLLSVRVGATELLWRNPLLLTDDLSPVGEHVFWPNDGRMGDWVNYGGDKTWPAPQGWAGPGQWAGPPDPVLDSGPYTVDVTPGTVTMTSGDDPPTGLRLTRRFSLADRGYRLDLTAKNVSDRPVRWALWNVTQFAGGGEVFVALRDHPAPVVDLVAGTGNPRRELTGGGALVPDQDVVGKLGFPGAAGSLSYTAGGWRSTFSFAVDTATYPDHGSPVEVWLEHPLPGPLAGLGDLDPHRRVRGARSTDRPRAGRTDLVDHRCRLRGAIRHSRGDLMPNRRSFLRLSGALGLGALALPTFTAHAEPKRPTSSPLAADPTTLWYPAPADEAKIIEEGLPIGNGRLGALVGVDPAKDFLYLTDVTLWTGELNDALDGDGQFLTTQRISARSACSPSCT